MSDYTKRKEIKYFDNTWVNGQRIPWNLLYILFNIFLLLLHFGTIRDLIELSLSTSPFTHIVLVPFVSGYLIYSKRKVVFTRRALSPVTGMCLVIAGLSIYLVGNYYGMKFNGNDLISLMSLSLVVTWTGGFIFFNGVEVFHEALFPLLFLVFMVPLPGMILDSVVGFLTKGSAEVTSFLFSLAGVPVFREGAVFSLPGLTIEVAKQCSGIRSATVLILTALLSGHLFLETGWRKVILLLSAVPITIFKNGLRIATITLLGAYVDRRILAGALHRRGGIPFFILALIFLGIVLTLLKKRESNTFEEKSSTRKQ